MNHETPLQVIAHIAILTILMTGVIVIGYTIFNEEFNKNYKQWKNNKRK